MVKINKDDLVEIDTYDKEILNAIMNDSKMPLRKLASALNISFVTVMNRIKKLEEKGVIKKYSTRLNYEKLGYGIHALVEMKISKGRLLELENKIAKFPNIYAVYDTTGQFDATLMGRFKTTREMDVFLKKLQTFDFVETTNTKLILNTIKKQQMRL